MAESNGTAVTARRLTPWRLRYLAESNPDGFGWRYGYMAADSLGEARALALAHVAIQELADHERVYVTPLPAEVWLTT